MDYFKDQSMQKYFNLEQLKSCAEGMIKGNLQS